AASALAGSGPRVEPAGSRGGWGGIGCWRVGPVPAPVSRCARSTLSHAGAGLERWVGRHEAPSPLVGEGARRADEGAFGASRFSCRNPRAAAGLEPVAFILRLGLPQWPAGRARGQPWWVGRHGVLADGAARSPFFRASDADAEIAQGVADGV